MNSFYDCPQLIGFILLLMLMSCNEPDKIYQYEVDNVDVTQPGIDKDNIKSELEFISLAYSDLFGTTLTNDQLLSLVVAYNSLGDKGLIADIIVRNFLNNPGADVPSVQEMEADIPGFIKDTYQRFYVREPSEYELWYLQDLIVNDEDMTPEILYYAFLTSDEYRFF